MAGSDSHTVLSQRQTFLRAWKRKSEASLDRLYWLAAERMVRVGTSVVYNLTVCQQARGKEENRKRKVIYMSAMAMSLAVGSR